MDEKTYKINGAQNYFTREVIGMANEVGPADLDVKGLPKRLR